MFLAYLYSVPLQRAWCCLTLVWNQKLNEIFSMTRLQSAVANFYGWWILQWKLQENGDYRQLSESTVEQESCYCWYNIVKSSYLQSGQSLESITCFKRNVCNKISLHFTCNKISPVQVQNILLEIKSCCSTETGGSRGSVVVDRDPGVAGRQEVGIFSRSGVDSA